MKGDKPLSFEHDKAYDYDVQKRVPSVEKAEKLLGFEANTDLDATLNEVIPWITQQIDMGNI